MHHKAEYGIYPSTSETWLGDVWNLDELEKYVQASPGKCIILIEGFAVNATSYLTEHVRHHSFCVLHATHDIHKPGGVGLLRKYSAVAKPESSHSNSWPDATWAFGGGLNNHSRAARRRMQELRVAKIQA
jgi:stearoyl-CoA desaturase (delta-9 desaturase)